MVKMIEVVGISTEGFTEAVKSAIAHIEKAGKTAYWFEVKEQRGKIKDGKIVEFQVKIAVGMECECKV